MQAQAAQKPPPPLASASGPPRHPWLGPHPEARSVGEAPPTHTSGRAGSALRHPRGTSSAAAVLRRCPPLSRRRRRQRPSPAALSFVLLVVAPVVEKLSGGRPARGRGSPRARREPPRGPSRHNRDRRSGHRPLQNARRRQRGALPNPGVGLRRLHAVTNPACPIAVTVRTGVGHIAIRPRTSLRRQPLRRSTVRRPRRPAAPRRGPRGSGRHHGAHPRTCSS